MAESTSILTIDIVTPERRIFSGKGSFAVFPGAEGELGILPGHAPLLSQLRTGEVKIESGQKNDYGVVSDGFIEVRENRISVVAQFAVMAPDIDKKEAETARLNAVQELQSTKDESKHAAIEAKIKLAQCLISAAAKVSAPKSA